ncbi:NADH dehydrogenase subunit N [bacterium A37T11]|nr:NADH dehydrogenase subunit N [bacterium A37T11]
MKQLVPDITNQLDTLVNGFSGIVPELVLAVTFLMVIFCGLFLGKRWSQLSFYISLAGIIVSAIPSYILLRQPTDTATSLFSGMIVTDRTGLYGRLLIALVCGLFGIFVQSNKAFRSHPKKLDDLYAILLCIQIGLNFMVLSIHWLMAFISIEMVSMGSYLLVGYLGKDARQTEASLKYALFGAACSAVMLYGLSLIYGFTGSLDFTDSAHLKQLLDTDPLFLLLAMLFVFTGVGFKLSFVPFHFWTPDVYQGAPTPVTAFLSTAPKIAGMILLTRILIAWPAAGFEFPKTLQNLFIAAAIATMLLGNLAALRQQVIKRMMAYSSIGHTGFLMMAILAYPQNAYQVLFFYLLVYSVMNMLVFMIVDSIENWTSAIGLADYRGLGKIYPISFFCLVVVLISLTGLPPTGGFMAKLMIFSSVYASWQAGGGIGLLLLLITGALTTVISLFFYFKVPLQAFLKERITEIPAMTKEKLNFMGWIAVFLTAAILLLGIYPQWFLPNF